MARKKRARAIRSLEDFGTSVSEEARMRTGESPEARLINEGIRRWRKENPKKSELNKETQEILSTAEGRRLYRLENIRGKKLAHKNLERDLEEKGMKLPKARKKTSKKLIEKADYKGGGKLYATQNKKYGGGVYPKVGNTGG